MKVSRDPAFDGSDRHRFLDRLETGVAREADRCFVITEALGREMARRGVPEDRIVVVPNGVHVDRFRPAERDRALEAELGLAGKTVIGYVGGLVDYEGLDVLLDAVASLKETRDDVRVIVVGDGPSERAVHAQAERLRLGDMIPFTGRVPQRSSAALPVPGRHRAVPAPAAAGVRADLADQAVRVDGDGQGRSSSPTSPRSPSSSRTA